MKSLQLWFAECVGTFTLVFIGCGAIAADIEHTGISIAFGLAVMAMIYSVGNISGAHLNPAVTIGFFAAGRLSLAKVPFYIISQLTGAFLAALLLRVLYPAHATLGATLPHAGVWQAFLAEVVFSFILMFVILNVSTGHKEKGIMAGVAVGGTVLMAALAGGPLSGASMNPARSLAPALVSGMTDALWLYMIAPIAGTLLASPTCRIIQQNECCAVREAEAKKNDERE